MSDRIRVQVGVTKNLGNFNSVRLDADYETTINSDEDIKDAYARAWAIAEAEVEAQVDAYESE